MQTDSSEAIFRQFARITGALASPGRLKLLDRLCQGEQTVEELANASGLSVSNTSRQLRMLAESRLAAVRRDPPRVYYRVADERVVRFWFALRELAREQLAEFEQVVAALVTGRDGLTPVSREDLVARMATGEAVLLDVRPEPEFRAGHIPGALSIPVDQIEARLASLPAGKDVIAYCRGPYCVLSVEAVEALRAHGIPALRLAEGFPEWKAAGLPVQVNGEESR
jgi:rhodanese-related sulfurtransferase